MKLQAALAVVWLALLVIGALVAIVATESWWILAWAGGFTAVLLTFASLITLDNYVTAKKRGTLK